MNDTNRAADRAEALTKVLAGAPRDNTDHAAVREYLHQLAEAGLSVVFIIPGTKVPADPRAPQKRNADDRDAREAAKAAGWRDWDKAKSPAGLALATDDTATLDRYLARYIKVYAPKYPEGVPVSLAVEVGGSGLVVVDCDTTGQAKRWYAAAGIGPEVAPTVKSPGQVGTEGNPDDPDSWAHSGGGHYWFTVPEGTELPGHLGAATFGKDTADQDGETGYAVLWDKRYVLIPPSTRPEGAYVQLGAVYELPGWLAEDIIEAGEKRAERAAERAAAANGTQAARIDAWASGVSWASILEPLGWRLTARPDGCGCEVWTAPGNHASRKSATAHDSGCARDGDDGGGNARLHIWTDNPGAPFDKWIADNGGTTTLSKLQAVAAAGHDGKVGAAMDAEGIDTTNTEALAVVDDLDPDYGRAGEATDDAEADDDTDEEAAPPTLTLPPEFWAKHPKLQRFHDMCLSHTTAPDAALGCTLARLSAHIPPDVRVTTGVRFSLPLNLFVFATSVTGAGKTTAAHAAEELVRFRLGWGADPMQSPVKIGPHDAGFPTLGSLKTGEGLVEAYYGERTLVIGQNKNGSPKTKIVRAVVRSNLLTTNDEGRTVITQINDEKASLGATLREMWSGATVGASLADKGRERLLRRGTYSLGVVIGTQQSVLGDLVTRTNIDEGTVQRFLMVWSTPGPYVTEELLAAVKGDHPPMEVTVPHMPLRLCAPLRERIARENTARFLGIDAADPDEHSMAGLDSQRAAMVSKLAALLEVFLADSDGPDPDPDDPAYLAVGELAWGMAEELFEVSCAIATDAARRRRDRRTNAARSQRAVARAEHVADVEARTTPQGRARAKLIGALVGAGPVRWSGKKGLRNRMFNGNKVAAAELERMVASGQVKRTENDGGSVDVELVYS